MKTLEGNRAFAVRFPSFARKGEACPVGNGHDNPEGGANACVPSTASVLSGLIRRKVSSPLPTATTIRFEPAVVTAATRAAAPHPPAPPAPTPRRQLTVRLAADDFQAIDRLKRATGSTYQRLVEMAVRFRYGDPD